MTENELKHAVLAIARKHGWLVFHMPAATIRGSQGRGYPDLTLAREGVALWMELKAEQGTLRPEQEDWAEHLPAGYYVVRPSDLEHVRGLLA